MSCILYYSNYCEPSKKLLQTVSKTQNANNIHFVCIDKRVKDNNGKIFIILQNEQRLLMPENVTRVPALLLLKENFNYSNLIKMNPYYDPFHKLLILFIFQKII